MSKPMPFSKQLDEWLKSKQPKTLSGLSEVVAEKSFAILFVVLMAIPALPIPTGGVTHVFEIIVMLLSLEMIAGFNGIWLPKRWLHRPLGKTLEQKALPYLSRKIRWMEKYSRPRLAAITRHRQARRLVGLLVLLLTVAAFITPPFSGLDTLPAMGIVAIGLAMILEDVVVFFIGLLLGLAGIILDIIFSAAIIAAFRHFL